VAGNLAVAHVSQHRDLADAAIDRHGAAGTKDTAGGCEQR
jgi:hypothetical protein